MHNDIEKMSLDLYQCRRINSFDDAVYVAGTMILKGYGEIKQYQEEIEHLKAENAKLKELYNMVLAYYKDLDHLAKRLQDDLGDGPKFIAEEPDKDVLCMLLDYIDNMKKIDNTNNVE